MKKKILFVVAVLTATLVQAKNHTIVINGHHPKPQTATEVDVDQTGNDDVLTITPAKDATTITITVKDVYGQIVAEGDVPANTEGVYELSTPETTEGGTIEVSDDTGLVHVEVE